MISPKDGLRGEHCPKGYCQMRGPVNWQYIDKYILWHPMHEEFGLQKFKSKIEL